jgi:hypothetical protein
MDEKINNLVPALVGEIELDIANEAEELPHYYMEYNS